MTSTEQDRFSTFSIDVDTGSYTIARRKLNEGMLPPAAAVRVEEFINYFPYEYDAPSGPAPFAVHMEATPNPFQDGHHILRVGVQAQEVDLSDRKPVHLTFLVDVSGSMSSPDKLGLAQRSLRFLVDQLQEGDTVALATYAGRVSAVLEPTDVSDRGAIHSAIMGLQSGGSTAMNSGIQLAYRMAQSAYVPNSENRVIVLSDGDANVGPSSHAAILNTIREYANNGITLSTIGFGMGNYQDTMMEQLANQGDGNYSYIDTYDEAKRVFGENLAGTLNVVARDVKLQVEFNPTAVSSYRLIGYENRDIADRDFRNDAVDAGEIGAGHTVTALYDLVLTDNSPEELATVRVRNKVPGPDAPAVEWLTTMPFDEITSSFTRATPSMRIAFSAATFAELLRGSPYAAEVSWEELIGLTSQAQRPGIAADDELLSLQQQAARLSGTRGTTASK
jgi:Ca-activated chloride channel family protein